MRTSPRRLPPCLTLVVLLATAAGGCKTADELACRAERGGNYDSCMYRVNRAHKEDRQHDEVDEPGCERGDQTACLRAAQYEQARGSGTDYDRKFRRACDANIGEACFEAGRRLLAPLTRTRGIQLMYRSCELGFHPACHDGPQLAAAGPERDRFELLACGRGVREACKVQMGGPP